MDEKMQLPEKIKALTGDRPYIMDSVGLSDSVVMTYDDMVLKIERYNRDIDSTIQMMQWLVGKIPVPKVICHESLDGMSYLLMSKVDGKMSCDEYYFEHPHEMTALLAEGLKMLWNVDISDCPRQRDLDCELEEAEYRVKNNLVDVKRAEPNTFGKNGFQSPAHLLEWLKGHKPAYEPVLSHGDFCLPNIFFDNGKISGFIDLGDMGVGDKWRDIALCWRSLKHNFDGSFGGKVYEDFNPDMIFEKLEMEPDYNKLRYYILLDELF